MAESFLQRWARRKAEQTERDRQADDASPAEAGAESATFSAKSPHDSSEGALPSLDDVARLTRDSDYSSFLSKGVDCKVRRAAMKKLFSDPHFNVMDGLDIYIDDYTKPSPLTPAMLAALRHTQPLFEAAANNERARQERDEALARAAGDAQQVHRIEAAEQGGAECAQDAAEAVPPDLVSDDDGSSMAVSGGRPGAEEGSDNSIRHNG